MSLTKVLIPSFPAEMPRDTATMIAGSPDESNIKKTASLNETCSKNNWVLVLLHLPEPMTVDNAPYPSKSHDSDAFYR